MKYLLILTFSFLINYGYSQGELIDVYQHKGKGFDYLIFMGCHEGYSYKGPHLLTEELFTYEVEGNAIIRDFDSRFSLHGQVDILKINKKSILDVDGLLLKKVKSRCKDALIEKYIEPISNSMYPVFLTRLESCRSY